jgi:Cytidylate kinase
MGSVIFPEAQVKFFLTASIETRARRHFKQLKDRGFSVSLPALIRDLDARDKRDKSTQSSPLVIPEGAFVIHTDDLTVIKVKKIAKDRVNNTYGNYI